MILAVLLCLSVFLNVSLALTVRNLRKTTALLQNTKRLRLNDFASPLEVLDLNGNRHAISYSDTKVPTVLYVFTPECDWCGRNLANIKALESQLRNRYRVLGVSLDYRELNQYVHNHGINFPVYHSPSEATRVTYDLVATPTTLIVSEGRVVRIWRGAYGGERRAEIEQFFEIKLPGLTEE